MLDGGLLPSLAATWHTFRESFKRCVLCNHRGREHVQHSFDTSRCLVKGCMCVEFELAGEDERIAQEIREAARARPFTHRTVAFLRGIGKHATPRQAARFERVASELELELGGVAEEIRRATARSELHPAVRDNLASPRGTCNANARDAAGNVNFCTLDYGHAGDEHVNGEARWRGPWPPE